VGLGVARQVKDRLRPPPRGEAFPLAAAIHRRGDF
jgi:hypothetical protein